ncbi:PP2C family serine/threonine-protein phosphatase [Desulfobacterales bacterium HSG2]|nr:PP2C family serine/threonine-protein phosphatase [Desulfobacterales bacterium HSG2]
MSSFSEKADAKESLWKFAGGAATGTSHSRGGMPCHDSFGYKLLDNSAVIIAVSDGAGSSAQPKTGSELSVATAIESLEEQLNEGIPRDETQWKSLIQEAFQKTREALERKASESETALREYASTLILVVLAEGWTVGGLIGDCAAVVLTEDEELVSLCQPQKGEYASTTNFLTQDDVFDSLDIRIRRESAQCVAVFSDGLLELALNIAHNKPYPPFFRPLFAFAESVENEQEARKELESFLDSERVNARTDDDKTMVLASCQKQVQENQNDSEESTRKDFSVV